MGIRISKDHLHPSVIESITSLIGDLNQLETTAKGNAVEAINELLANGGNKEELEALIAEIAEGKELIANAVGEPLTAEESFDEMSNDINGLLSTFKTNMMKNGITVESGDKFKALIDKIATMVEEGEGKGIQYKTGTRTVTGYSEVLPSFTYDEMGIDFTPTLLFIQCDSVYLTSSMSIHVNKPNRALSPSGFHGYFSNITNSGFQFMIGKDDYTTTTTYNLVWHAIGVGEEDTTIRDSLASILENKGIDITEEDDMASLITKVDNNLINIPKSYTLYESGVTSDDLGGWTTVHEDLRPNSSDARYGSATITVADDGLIVTVKNGSAGGLRSGHKSNNYFSLVNYTKIKADITLISDMVNSDARDWFGIKLYDSADNAIAENSFGGTATALTTFTLEIDVTNINVAKVSILGRTVGSAETVDIKCTKIWLE